MRVLNASLVACVSLCVQVSLPFFKLVFIHSIMVHLAALLTMVTSGKSSVSFEGFGRRSSWLGCLVCVIGFLFSICTGYILPFYWFFFYYMLARQPFIGYWAYRSIGSPYVN